MRPRSVLVSATLVWGLSTIACGLLACASGAALAADDGAPAHAAAKGRLGALKERVLQRFDKDADGKLSPEERQAARDALVDRILKRFDADGDGKLSRDELAAAIVALRNKFQEARERRAGKGPAAGRGPHL